MHDKSYSANLLDFMSSSEPISEIKKNLDKEALESKSIDMPMKKSSLEQKEKQKTEKKKVERKPRKQKPATLLKIGNVAKMLELNTSVLRFWEDEFEELNPVRTKTGQRLYSAQDIAIAKRLKKLLHENGLTLEGAKKILKKSSLPKGSAYISVKSGKVKALSLNSSTHMPDLAKQDDTQAQDKSNNKEEHAKKLSFLKAIEAELLEIKKKLI